VPGSSSGGRQQADYFLLYNLKHKTMSKVSRQVADMQASTGVTTAESNEFQRCWENQRWDRAGKEGNYDRTRDHLNFEIARGGVIRPIDKSLTVGDRIAGRLAECGITDPNIGRKTPNIRICAKFIFGGSRERMHELAFGNQQVDLAKGADNSHIIRCKDIEGWAKDIYKFVCEKWGEDNIAGFYVHLDETNPHIHCCILPITEQNRLSFKQVFSGATKWEYRDKMLALHDGLAVYNRKWGLERGSNIQETGARHRSTEEYRRELSAECTALERRISEFRRQLIDMNRENRKAQIKQKGLSTMIRNLEQERTSLLSKKAELEDFLQKGKGDTNLLESALEKLSREIDLVNDKLADKRDKLANAEEELQELQTQINELQQKEAELRAEASRAADNIQQQVQYRLSTAILPDILQEFKVQSQYLNFKSMDLFENTLLKDLTENGEDIMQCAMLLFAGYVDKATTFAEGSSGGGSDSQLKWGRDEDEDDKAWARRCMLMAHRMVKTGKGKKKSR
jgi:predicted  nucleic acid-binding Zn-ribbon protein